jgi:hypothetical protein
MELMVSMPLAVLMARKWYLVISINRSSCGMFMLLSSMLSKTLNDNMEKLLAMMLVSKS